VIGGHWKDDPGPCPVDDTPHTACTVESVALRSRVSQTCTVPITPPRTFTTASYRRPTGSLPARVPRDPAVHPTSAARAVPHVPPPVKRSKGHRK